MKATADTNVLLRALLDDHPSQSAAARRALAEAERIAVTLPTLCEVAWVLRRGYGRSGHEIAAAIEAMAAIPDIALDHAAVGAGLSLLAQGGDFADGVIAFEGGRLGGETFLTFDREAAGLLERAGVRTMLLPS